MSTYVMQVVAIALQLGAAVLFCVAAVRYGASRATAIDLTIALLLMVCRRVTAFLVAAGWGGAVVAAADASWLPFFISAWLCVAAARMNLEARRVDVVGSSNRSG